MKLLNEEASCDSSSPHLGVFEAPDAKVNGIKRKDNTGVKANDRNEQK
ncbi:hypothetical protein [Paenibacillus sp. MABNR03]